MSLITFVKKKEVFAINSFLVEIDAGVQKYKKVKNLNLNHQNCSLSIDKTWHCSNILTEREDGKKFTNSGPFPPMFLSIIMLRTQAFSLARESFFCVMF